MNCDETTELLSASLDGMLDQGEQERLDAHLADCADCRSELEQLRRAVSLLQETEPMEVPPGLEARIVRAIRQPARPIRAWNWFNRPQVRVALAAGIAVVVGVFAIQKMTPTIERRELAAAADTVQTARPETRAVAPAIAPAKEEKAPAIAPVPTPMPARDVAAEDARESRELERPARERALAEQETHADKVPNAAPGVSRKKRSDAIWRQETPVVREGLQVGSSTPLSAAESAPAAPRPEFAAAARDGVPSIAAPQPKERASADALLSERVVLRQEEMEEGKAKVATLRPRLEGFAGEDSPRRRVTASREVAFEAAPAAALAEGARGKGAPVTEELLEKTGDGRLSFTVAGIDEKRVLALLAAVPKPDEQRSNRDMKTMSSGRADVKTEEDTTSPAVTHLADGRTSIVVAVPFAELTRILAALGKEGAVRPSRGQVMHDRSAGTVVVELVLVP